MTNLPQEGISPDEVKGRTDESSASNGQTLREIFGDPIDIYTDADGLEDGTLVDLTQFTRVSFLGIPINRMTRPLFEAFKSFHDDADENPKKFGACLGSTLRFKLKFAQAHPGNCGEIGDKFTIPPNLWLVLNEVGGWTAMYPDEY
jgi:hypothetical protein